MGFVLKKIPENLYKFYPFDDRYNNSRLTGKVFLATPFLFNDPSDCRIGISNNTSELNKDGIKLKTKLEEIGLSDDKYVMGLLNNDVEIVEEVWNKQLSKLGVLCLSKKATDKLFWGYYTNNDGFCVEYDGEKIVERIVIAYINCLDYELTEHLFERTKYSQEPSDRCKNKKTSEIDKAVKIFNVVDLASITNPYLRPFINSKRKQALVRNFIINICLKRFGCNNMIYKHISKMKAPKLFYTGNENDILDKYYTKTKDWKKEDEFRIVASLGGNMLADLGKDMVKSIRFGCNITLPHFVSLLSILAKEDMTDVPLYKMKNNLAKGELEDCPLDNKLAFYNLQKLESLL